MSNDERPDSLAAQAAAWVPPWERQRPEPDRDYQGARRAEAEAELRTADQTDDDLPDEPEQAPEPDPGGGDESSADVPAELAALPGEATGPATVDAPQELPGEWEEPTGVALGPELTMPAPVQEAAEEDEPDNDTAPVDAPLPPDTLTVGDGDAGGEGVGAADADGEGVGAADAGGEGVGDEYVDHESVPPPTRAEVGPIAPAGRAEAGSAVPVQGRRRRDGGVAVGGPTSRTSAGVDLSAEGPGDSVPAGADAQGELPAVMDDDELAGALEAIMLVVDEPAAELQLAQILQQPAERIATMLEDLSARYTAAGHGFDLRRVAGGWRLYTRPEYATYVERFVLDGQSVRLTQAALETLAVVAYKQPVTRSRISAIRGVNVDGVMRTLVTRGLIEECGIEGETGAHLYRTTPLFLEKLGINSVDELPPLAPFLPNDVEEVLDATG